MNSAPSKLRLSSARESALERDAMQAWGGGRVGGVARIKGRPLLGRPLQSAQVCRHAGTGGLFGYDVYRRDVISCNSAPPASAPAPPLPSATSSPTPPRRPC